MPLEAFDWNPSTSQSLRPDELEKLCSNWAENYTTVTTNVVSTPEIAFNRPSHFLVWTLGLSFVTIISLCALVGIAVMRCLHKAIFDKFITFFVSVGVGSLSGSAVFHLLPQTFGLVNEFSQNSNHDYLFKALAALIGIYLFFFSDKAIKIILETKKRKYATSTELSLIKNPISKSIGHNHENGTERYSERSSEALLVSSNNAKQINPKELNEAYTNDESYNRQAHSLCIHDHDMQYKEGDSVIATVAWMIIFGDGLHNLIDGISIGASFSESILSGISVSVAVLCEEFPHELGDVAILVSAGMTLRQALVYNLLSALTCYVGFVIGVVVGNLDDSFASYTFGFAGGMFLYISMACMMPEMKHVMEEALQVSFVKALEVLILQALGVFTGLGMMACIARYGTEISF